MVNFKKVVKMGSKKTKNPNKEDQKKYKEKVKNMQTACVKFDEEFRKKLDSPKEWQRLLKGKFERQMGKSRLKSRTSRVLHDMSKKLSKFKGGFDSSKVTDYINAFKFTAKKANPKDDYIKRSAIDDANVVYFFTNYIPDLLKEANPLDEETGTFTVRKQEDFGKVNGCKTKIKKIIIRENIKTVEKFAFSDCTALESIDLKNVETVGEYAFSDCKALETVNLGNNVKTIGKSAFWGCKALETVNLGNNVKTIGKSAFFGCTKLNSIILNKNKVETIGEFAFCKCKALQGIDLGGVTNIGELAFSGCKALKRVVFGDNVETIGESAFSECEALEKIDLSGVTNIGKSAFFGCTKLNSIILNKNKVETIGEFAFSGCINLDTVTLPTNGKAGDIKKIILDQTGKGEGTIKFINDPDKPANQ